MRESVSVCIDGSTKYYEYVLLCTDDCLAISGRGESILRDEIDKYFTLNESFISKVLQWQALHG